MGWGAIAAAAASLISSLISAGFDGEAMKIRQQMAAEYGDEILPVLDEAVAQQATSALGSASEDPTARNAQLGIDAELAEIYDTAGQTSEDQAAYDVARRNLSQRAGQQAGNAAIAAAQRGQQGGALQQVLAAQSGQSELDALGGMNAQIAADSRGRALQALMGRGNLAGQMRSQDWGARRDILSAQDLMNRFNASQRQGVEMYNAQLPQTQFTNRLAMLAGRNNALAGVASGLEASGAAARQTGAGIGNAALSYGQAYEEDQKGKK